MAAPLTPQQEDQYEVMRAFLNQYGLGALDVDVKNWIINGLSPERVNLELRKTKTFRDAFPEIVKREELGLSAVSPEDVINYRREVKTVMFNAGLPPGFYDQPDDFVDLMAVKDLSPMEIKSRVQDGFTRVNQAPTEVKDAFNSFFGAQGENALAAFFLDPQRATADLTRQVAQAEVSGTGKRFGFNVNLTKSEQLASMGIGMEAASQGFSQANQLRPIAEETIGETDEITDENLINAQFGADAGSQGAIQRRQQQRSAAFGGQAGGPAQTRTGLGLGSGNR